MSSERDVACSVALALSASPADIQSALSAPALRASFSALSADPSAALFLCWSLPLNALVAAVGVVPSDSLPLVALTISGSSGSGSGSGSGSCSGISAILLAPLSAARGALVHARAPPADANCIPGVASLMRAVAAPAIASSAAGGSASAAQRLLVLASGLEAAAAEAAGAGDTGGAPLPRVPLALEAEADAAAARAAAEGGERVRLARGGFVDSEYARTMAGGGGGAGVRAAEGVARWAAELRALIRAVDERDERDRRGGGGAAGAGAGAASIRGLGGSVRAEKAWWAAAETAITRVCRVLDAPNRDAPPLTSAGGSGDTARADWAHGVGVELTLGAVETAGQRFASAGFRSEKTAVLVRTLSTALLTRAMTRHPFNPHSSI